MRDLTDEMGINAPSLYNAFGDKRQLFILALDRYAMTTMRARLQRLETEHPPRAAIEAFFAEIVSRSVTDPDRRGCLIVNSALEVAPHDPEIRRAIQGYFREIESFLRGRVEAGQAAGEIAGTHDAGDTARMLLGLLVAVRVLSRTGATRRQLDDMLRPALGALAAPPAPPAGPSASPPAS